MFYLHVWLGFGVILIWLFWFLYLLFSKQSINYHSSTKFKDFYNKLLIQAGYYTKGFFLGHEKPHKVEPFNKFNPMQKITYQYFMFFIVPLILITGVLLWQAVPLAGVIALLGGSKVVHVIHFLLFCVFVFFIPVHAYMGFLGNRPLDHYKEMFHGYEEE
jgi:thiosulfate reductase cytochrome b subunit